MSGLKRFSTAELVAAAIILVAAVGMGMGIRHIMKVRAAAKEPPGPVAKAPVAGVEADESPMTAGEPSFEAVEDAVQAEEVAPDFAMESVEEFAAEVELPRAEPQQEYEQPQRSSDEELYESVFGDFRLSREDNDRYRAGMRQLVARFENMSQGDRREVLDEMGRLRERWESMNDSEARAWLLGIRDGLEDWRRSGDIDLPAPRALWIGIGIGEIDVPD